MFCCWEGQQEFYSGQKMPLVFIRSIFHQFLATYNEHTTIGPCQILTPPRSQGLSVSWRPPKAQAASSSILGKSPIYFLSGDVISGLVTDFFGLTSRQTWLVLDDINGDPILGTLPASFKFFYLDDFFYLVFFSLK